MFFTTEITSSGYTSDLPMLLRTQTAYKFVEEQVHGNVLEIGCGEGYGLDKIHRNSSELYLLDKSSYSERSIKKKYDGVSFYKKDVQELEYLDLPEMDFIICFQFIEHIFEQEALIESLIKLLKPGGILFLTTPNSERTLFPNPWHFKELNLDGFRELTSIECCSTQLHGIFPSQKLEVYYEDNDYHLKGLKKWTLPIVRRSPRSLLKLPYEIGNRINRIKLKRKHRELFKTLNNQDYYVAGVDKNALDFLAVVEKRPS